MKDISHHIKSNCVAVAEISLRLDEEAWKHYDKSVFTAIEIATELAVKNAHVVIPKTHFAQFDCITLEEEQKEDELIYKIMIKAIHKADLDAQAYYGASVAGIALVQLLKGKGKVEMGAPRMLKSKNALQQSKRMHPSGLRAAVIVCSDSISEGTKTDAAGKAIMAELEACGVKVDHYEVIPDEKGVIAEKAKKLAVQNNMIIYTGGTGLSFRDVTPEALEPLMERRIPGIEEAIRAYGQERVPFAMLSRSVVGTIGNCLVMALPGSTNGARESMQAIFPHVLHVFKIMRGERHD